MNNWERLKNEVIDNGLCTQCGSCVGLSKGVLRFEESDGVLLPAKVKDAEIGKDCYEGCPARYCNYVELNQYVFSKIPENWLLGNFRNSYIGYANDEMVRLNSASGGIISSVLIYLLENKRVDGVICVKLGVEKPYLAKAVIARTRKEVLECSQSVYSVTPVNVILQELEKEKENARFAYVGLPDQVASVRKLQMLGNKTALKIKYIIGPYTGTQMHFESIRSFLRSHNVQNEDEILRLKYRAGEWPGYLEIKLKNGGVLRAEKFYYNYLIPFYITSSSLQVVDFTNELTDISVGDAWHPKYEKLGKGFSVVLARSIAGNKLLKEMENKKMIILEDVDTGEILGMHGHMLDFKKRGSFIRNSWKKIQPEYGYYPEKIAVSREMVEYVLRVIFWIGKRKLARRIIEQVPLGILGPCFDFLRKQWKNASKPTKRRGLQEMRFVLEKWEK